MTILKKDIKVYRYENSEGNGPYSHIFSFIRLDDTNNNPTPEIDGLDFINQDYLFACETLCSLDIYFKNHKTQLLSFGYKIFEYKVKRFVVGHSKTQGVFYKGDVVCKKEVSCKLNPFY
jgi:hypothetical protein